MKFGKILTLAAAALVLGSCGQGGGSTTTSQSTSSGSSSSGSSTSTPVAKTAEDVIKDICNALFGSAVADEDYGDDGYGGFVTGVDFGPGTESQLEDACDELVDCMPSYLVLTQDSEAGKWEDDSNGYFAFLETSDGEVWVDLGSYVEDGTLYGQVDVYPAED